MATWTHKTVEINWTSLSERDAALDAIGADGWELVTIIDWKQLTPTGTAPVFTSRATFKQSA